MLGEQSGFRGTIRERRQAGGKESESQHTLLLHTAGEAEWIKACSEGQRQNLEPKQSFKFGRFFRYCPRSCSQQARKGFFSQSGHSANQKGFLVEKQHFLPWSTSRIDGYSNPFFLERKPGLCVICKIGVTMPVSRDVVVMEANQKMQDMHHSPRHTRAPSAERGWQADGWKGRNKPVVRLIRSELDLFWQRWISLRGEKNEFYFRTFFNNVSVKCGWKTSPKRTCGGKTMRNILSS